MITIQGWDIQGFKTFERNTAIDVPGPGLIAVCGANLVHPVKGANGIGKTALADALCWILYDRTVRGQRGPSVRSWNSEEALVGVVDLVINDQSIRVTRTHDPNSLTLQTNDADPEVIDQQKLDELLGMNHSLFCSTVLLSAWGQPFMTLTPTARLDALSRVLRLSYWEERTKAATSNVSRITALIEGQRVRISHLAGQAEELQRSLDRTSALDETWASEGSIRLAKTKRLIDAAATDLAEQRRQHAKAEERQAEAYEEHSRRTSEVNAQTKRVRANERDLEKKRARLTEIQGELRAKLQAGGTIEALRSGSCPGCEQTVPREQLAYLIELYRTDLARLRSVEDSWIRNEIYPTEHVLTVVNKKLREAIAAEEFGYEAHRKLVGVVETIATQIERQKAIIDRHNRDVEDLRRETSPYLGEIAELERRCSTNATAKKKETDALKEMESSLAVAQSWVKGFKDLRMWACEEALAEISAMASASLEPLGLEGWEIKAELADVNKSSRGCVVKVKSPASQTWVAWESWSGGESQRLIIAGSIGFADATSSRADQAFNLEIWDELTNHLSPEGCESVLAYLRIRSDDTRKTVLFTDHASASSGEFDGFLCVTLTERGSEVAAR